MENKTKKNNFILNENNLQSYLWLILNEYLYYYDDVVTIFQANLQKGVYIPRFCYHVKLKLSGNCRLCFVEDSEVLKPVISCSTLISDEMEVFTHTQLVFDGRESMLEFLLINHPLDCPVCDQGGECDLQDQFMVFGGINSKYYEKIKKNILDKNLSNSIKLSLNKCINCSRCVRYSQDVLSNYSFSLLGRGFYLEISNYDNFIFKSEFSGNVIDLCPVGAITSKFYSFINRYWELIDFKFIDIFDTFNTFIRIDFSGFSLIRILPLENVYLNEEWFSDKVRFNFDGFVKLRLLNCFFFVNFYYIVMSWYNIFNLLKDYFIKIINFFFIKKKKFFYNNVFFSSVMTDFYLFNFVKYNFIKINFNNFLINLKLEKLLRKNFYFFFKDIDFLDDQDFLFLGINLRLEYPVFNIKLREKANIDYSVINNIGFLSNLNYFFLHLGNNMFKFIKFFNFENLGVFIGYSFLKLNFKIINLYNYIYKKILNLNFNLYNLFCFKNIFIFANEINLISVKNNITFFNFYFNYFNLNYSFSSLHLKKNINSFFNKIISIYQGSNFNEKLNIFNVILPSKLFLEKSFVYINILGVFADYTYMFYKFFINNLKTDLKIIKNILELLSINRVKKFISFKYFFVNKQNRSLLVDLSVFNFYFLNIFYMYKNYFVGTNSIVNNFYLNDIISECSEVLNFKFKEDSEKNDYNFFFINKFQKWLH